jgi:NADPH:quinone reductase-like Zn-dependent oxidoreductase
VRVVAIGLNFADLFTCLGLYNAAPKTDFVPGLEFSGVVEAVGSGIVEAAVGSEIVEAAVGSGIVEVVSSGAVEAVSSGLVEAVASGIVEAAVGSTIAEAAASSGVVEVVSSGVVEALSNGVVEALSSGIVQAVEGSRGLKVGDRVMGVTRFGSYTTHINVNEILVRPSPLQFRAVAEMGSPLFASMSPCDPRGLKRVETVCLVHTLEQLH